MKNAALLSCGVLVCLYAAVVVWYAQRSPDIGLQCAFETEIQKVEPSYIAWPTSADALPRSGDLILRIGPREIRTWPDYVRTLAALGDRERFPAQSLPAGYPLAELPALGMQGTNRVLVGDEDLIRVEFSRDGVPVFCWCRIGTPPIREFVPSLLWFLVKLGLFLIGALVLWKRPDDLAARRFFLLCVVTVGAFMGGYHWLRIASSPPLVVVFMICAVLLPVVSLHFYLVYPRPKSFLQRRPRLTIGLLYGPPGLVLVLMLATYTAAVLTYRLWYDAQSVYLISRILLYLIYIAVMMAGLLFGGCVLSLIHSFRTSRPGTLERNQVKWIMTGALLATGPIGYTLFLAAVETESFGLGGATWPMFAASLCITLAYAVSISRYGLMEVGQFINWGIVSVAVSIGAGLVYSGLVFLGTWLIGSQMETQSPFRQAAWASLTAWLLLLALDLARWQLRKAIDRRFHREKYQLEKTLRRMSQAVEQMVDPPSLARRLLHALAELLNFTHGAIYLKEGDPPLYRLAAYIGSEPELVELPPGSPVVDALCQSPLVRARGSRNGPPPEPSQRQLASLGGEVAVALRHEGNLTAILLAGPRLTGQYELEEVHLLTTFAQIGGLALHGARGHQTIEGLNRDLQSKVEKISEQQRRIVALQSQLLRQADRPAAPPEPGLVAPGIVGSSPVVQQLLQTVRKVAVSPSAVLIRGESGTGKELFAQALHDNSPRAAKPFVKVHCAALSSGLLESELFGHVKGAFTGAHRDKVGRFELADGGSLFLDEIGDISLEVQTKLLRVLQEMTFERVGSSDPIKVDVRLIAATNQNLEQLMREGRFREDLFYRLNVITIRTPPLRERREDVYELALHFLKLHSQRSGKALTGIDDDALEVLKGYSWPGNIRELENVIERGVVLAEGPTITRHELPEELVADSERGLEEEEPAVHGPGWGRTNGDPLVAERDWAARQEDLERERLVRALAAAEGNKARAARSLGMPRSTLLSKLEKHGLIPRRTS